MEITEIGNGYFAHGVFTAIAGARLWAPGCQKEM